MPADDETEAASTSKATEDAPPPHRTGNTPKRIAREDLAEALACGEWAYTRQEAVAALETRGFRKTAAYKALSPDGKLAGLLGFTPNGLIAWNG